MAEAELGRRGEERLRAGGDWPGADRLPADPGGDGNFGAKYNTAIASTNMPTLRPSNQRMYVSIVS